MKEDFNDFLIDSQLNIHTTGRNDVHSDTHRYPYEPTTYTVLSRIVESGFIDTEDVVLDYGSGLGRVPIFLHDKIGCKTIGIELVSSFYESAVTNRTKYFEWINENRPNKSKEAESRDILFINGKAEDYSVPESVTACFFFNPFDIGLFRAVMKKILESFYQNPRGITLFFYYPQDAYVGFLATIPEISFVDEIDCMDLFKTKDDRNRVMVFEIE